MGVRNCRDIGENLRLVMQRLMANQKLVKLLYYDDKDPLSHNFSELVGSGKQYKTYEEFCNKEIFEKLIKITPRVGPKETATSALAIEVVSGMQDSKNSEFKNLKMVIEVIVPFTQWIIKSDNLRPFLILGEIQDSLCGKTINGLGKMEGGDFQMNFLTDEVTCYEQEFYLISYD